LLDANRWFGGEIAAKIVRFASTRTCLQPTRSVFCEHDCVVASRAAGETQDAGRTRKASRGNRNS
jgi:hypothetical protein